MTTDADRESRILLFLPIASDNAVVRRVLQEAGFISEAFSSIDEICQEVVSGTGMILLGIEALTPPALDRLTRTLSQQPPWSDIPLLILISGDRGAGAINTTRWALDTLSNATFLERPIRIAILLQAVKVALNSRRRQYDTREYLREREQAATEHVALLEKQRVFLRDVLLSVTEGKLHLCHTPADLPNRFPPIGKPISLTARSLKEVRGQVIAAAKKHEFEEERAEDFATGASEAAMNAVVHAGGGIGSVGCSAEKIQVWVEDQGSGIDVERLPRATLERGFSSVGTLGHGFWLLLKFCDRVYILTGLSGTTVVLELDRHPPQPGWAIPEP